MEDALTNPLRRSSASPAAAHSLRIQSYATLGDPAGGRSITRSTSGCGVLAMQIDRVAKRPTRNGEASARAEPHCPNGSSMSCASGFTPAANAASWDIRFIASLPFVNTIWSAIASCSRAMGLVEWLQGGATTSRHATIPPSRSLGAKSGSLMSSCSTRAGEARPEVSITMRASGSLEPKAPSASTRHPASAPR